MNNYDDIIELPRHTSSIHPPMSMENRAAQFAPFAALTGHESAIAEVGRITTPRLELTPDEQQSMSSRLTYAMKHRLAIYITHYVPDDRKQGGKYIVVKGTVKKIDETEGVLLLTDNIPIRLDDILSIESESFPDID